jgi:hypothetical protein
VLEKALPHLMPRSNNHLTPLEKALGFLQGIFCEARKLTHVAYLRCDPLVPDLLGIQRVASQSTLSRFFAAFGGVAANARCFRVLWNWTMKRLPSRREGYTLDLDSTKLLHEDGHQEGVESGFTRQGIKPCLHPLLAVLAEARLVASFWLQAGNASCANNTVSFVHDLIANLPTHIRLFGVRADSGFCVPELLEFFESRRLRYVVVGRLHEKIQSLLRADLDWKATEVPGMEVAERVYQAAGWKRARRLRECDQGTPARLWNLGVDLREIPRHRGGARLGCGGLQFDRAFPAGSWLADQSDDPFAAILDFYNRRTHLQPSRSDHDQNRRSGKGTGLVETTLGENPPAVSQLQCSRKPTGFYMRLPPDFFGLYCMVTE